MWPALNFCVMNAKTLQTARTPIAGFFTESSGDQAKFAEAKSQLARLLRKVSTNFGRALR